MFIAYRNRRVTGDETYVLGFVVDITEKVRTEERLSALKQQSNSILESVGDGIFGMDLEGRATIINPAAAEMLGYKPDELLGSDVHSLMHHSYADGSEYPISDCRISSVVRERAPVRVSNEVFWRKDGTSMPKDSPPRARRRRRRSKTAHETRIRERLRPVLFSFVPGS